MDWTATSIEYLEVALSEAHSSAIRLSELISVQSRLLPIDLTRLECVGVGFVLQTLRTDEKSNPEMILLVQTRDQVQRTHRVE